MKTPSKPHFPARSSFPALLAIIAAFFCAIAATPHVRAEIIGVETFSYPDEPIADKTGGIYWDFNNTNGTHSSSTSDWDDVTNAPTVVGGRLITNNSGAKREYNGPDEGTLAGSDEIQGAVHGGNVHKTVYYRVTCTTGDTLPSWFGLSSYDFGAERLFFGKPGGASNFGLEISGGGASSFSTVAIQTNTTYTLVAKVSFEDDTMALFVDPDFAAPEPSVPTASQAYTDTYWSTAVRLASSGGGGSVQWDNLVVATSWDDLGVVVTTTTDEDNGSLGGGTGISLREAINYAPANSLITFASSLSGATIELTGTQLTVDKSLTIDASNLPNGVTIDADQQSRVMLIEENATVALQGLTLTGGKTSDGTIDNSGGGIYVNSNCSLRLSACTISGNHTGNGGDGASSGLTGNFGGNGGYGGGIYVDSNSSLTLSACTISGNYTGNGGNGGNYTGSGAALGGDGGNGGFGGGFFVDSNSSLTLSACTISGNYTGNGGLGGAPDGGDLPGGYGGGIYYVGSSLNIFHCTIAGNVASDGRGGGILYSNPGVVLFASIVADNVGRFSNQDDINQRFSNAGSITTGPHSYVGELTGWVYDSAPLTTGSINLAPLGDYGGPTQTMIPLLDSPAINPATSIPRTQDQRGFPITDATPDIGAAEFRGLPDLWNIDLDGDGNSFGVEVALGTDPFVFDSTNSQNLQLQLEPNGNRIIEFGFDLDAVGTAIWIIERSFDLQDWQEIYRSFDPREGSAIPADGVSATLQTNSIVLTDRLPPAELFYRFRAQLEE